MAPAGDRDRLKTVRLGRRSVKDILARKDMNAGGKEYRVERDDVYEVVGLMGCPTFDEHGHGRLLPQLS